MADAVAKNLDGSDATVALAAEAGFDNVDEFNCAVEFALDSKNGVFSAKELRELKAVAGALAERVAHRLEDENIETVVEAGVVVVDGTDAVATVDTEVDQELPHAAEDDDTSAATIAADGLSWVKGRGFGGTRTLRGLRASKKQSLSRHALQDDPIEKMVVLVADAISKQLNTEATTVQAAAAAAAAAAVPTAGAAAAEPAITVDVAVVEATAALATAAAAAAASAAAVSVDAFAAAVPAGDAAPAEPTAAAAAGATAPALAPGDPETEHQQRPPSALPPPLQPRRPRRSHHPRTPRAVNAISPSSVSDFNRCRRLFKYRHLDRMWEPTSPVLLRGVLVHEALAKLYECPPEERGIDRLHETFRQAWIKRRADPRFAGLFDGVEEERAWGLKSMELLANYLLVDAPKITHPISVEHRIFCSFDGPGDPGRGGGGMNVTGVLDRLDRGPHRGLVVIDYKTGRAPTLDYSQRTNMRILHEKFFQLKIYALLVQKSLGEMPRELKLVYLDGPTTMTFPLKEKDLVEVETVLRQTWKNILAAVEAQDFPPTPSRVCNWCSFKPICPAFAPDVAEAAAAPTGRGQGEEEPVAATVSDGGGGNSSNGGGGNGGGGGGINGNGSGDSSVYSKRRGGGGGGGGGGNGSSGGGGGGSSDAGCSGGGAEGAAADARQGEGQPHPPRGARDAIRPPTASAPSPAVRGEATGS
ncbi:unnamed protein product [Phaeothamnion confervicola]